MTENVLTLQDIGIQPKCAEDILPTYLGARSTRPLTVKPQRRSYSTSPRYPASSPQIVHTVSDYRELINAHRRKNPDLKIGFIPTMGALHAGHLSLARQARQQIPSPNLVVASIFVNPAQFAPTEDLDKYPRTLDQDVKLLAQQNTDIVFAPSVSEMYPRGITLNTKAQNGTFVEVLGLSSQMEGQIRPHFFRGVATVVAKLFNIIQPTTAYFGQKDVQQCAVVRSMVRDLHMPLEVVVSPTVRETDGLAMSSRNAYLTPEERVVAPVLYRAMCTAQQLHLQGAKSRERILKAAKDVIDAEPGAVYEYLSLADPFDLQEVNMVGSTGAILSGAVRIGKTRIIDNILLDLEPESVGGQKTKKA
ncbi:Pantoate-beta-alanine ligase [Gaertneriomyces semiglobifer]|nr:Pantoate-beta-alanine ligase [Gaertneriomyces semiglobifer]